jgi:hypothetical protein
MFAELPADIWLEIGSHLPIVSLAAIFATSTSFYAQYTLENIVYMLQHQTLDYTQLFLHFPLFSRLYNKDVPLDVVGYIRRVRAWLLGTGPNVAKSLCFLLQNAPASNSLTSITTLLQSEWIQQSGCFAAILGNHDWLAKYANIASFQHYKLLITNPLPHEFWLPTDNKKIVYFYNFLVNQTHDAQYITRHMQCTDRKVVPKIDNAFWSDSKIVQLLRRGHQWKNAEVYRTSGPIDRGSSLNIIGMSKDVYRT